MQDDLTDGTRWLMARGVADPRRVGIYGQGCGGYAAMMALAMEPELYRAGARLGGISELQSFVDDYRRYAGLPS